MSGNAGELPVAVRVDANARPPTVGPGQSGNAGELPVAVRVDANARPPTVGSTGETALSRLLAGLDPALDPQRWRFIELDHATAVPGDCRMYFREAEAATAILPAEGAAADADCWAQITCRVHSSLQAVGMLAAISQALAEAGLPCNAVAASRHDHLFVPWNQRERALAVLRRQVGNADRSA